MTQAAPHDGTTQPAERSAKETRKHLEDLACAPLEIRHSVHVVTGAPSLPEQPADRALLYVMRLDWRPVHIQSKLSVDRRWVGINDGVQYFYLTLEPGPHYFCSVTYDYPTLLSFVMEAGKTYYLQQKLTPGGYTLELLPEDEGKKGLAKCKLTTFEEKR